MPESLQRTSNAGSAPMDIKCQCGLGEQLCGLGEQLCGFGEQLCGQESALGSSCVAFGSSCVALGSSCVAGSRPWGAVVWPLGAVVWLSGAVVWPWGGIAWLGVGQEGLKSPKLRDVARPDRKFILRCIALYIVSICIARSWHYKWSYISMLSYMFLLICFCSCLFVWASRREDERRISLGYFE